MRTPRSVSFGRSDADLDLNLRRQAAVKGLDSTFVEVSVNEFLDTYLLYSIDDNAYHICLNTLRSKKQLDGSNCWPDFPEQVPPSGEDKFYGGRISQMVDDICAAYSTGSKAVRHTTYNHRPSFTPTSKIQGSSFKINAFFQLLNSTVPKYKTRSCSKTFSADLVANWEFKCNRTLKPTQDNQYNVVGAATHFMCNDPRRLYTYSVSIEGYCVRLWYFSRSHAVKSDVFDLRTDSEPFIKFIIKMSFANESQLGFDQTVTRHREPNDNIYYVYKIKGRRFKTTSCISEYFAAAIPGRATRVWEVHEIDAEGKKVEGSEPCVLKDCWVDTGDTEKRIQEAIFSELNALRLGTKQIPPAHLPSDKEEEQELRASLKHYEDYFVTVECEEVLTDHETTNIFPSQLRCTLNKDLPLHSSQPAHDIGTQRTGHDGHHSAVIDDSLQPCVYDRDQSPSSDQSSSSAMTASAVGGGRPFQPKQHCRLIYKECCRTIAHLSNFQEITKALYDCVMAIHLLYLAGYIHRDISAGNVLFKDTGRLSDFEYARRFSRSPDDVAGDPKTGTPAFMAIEVRRGTFMTNHAPLVGSLATGKTPALVHSFLHDVESAFWLGLWLCTTHSTVELSSHRKEPRAFQQHRDILNRSLFASEITAYREDVIALRTINKSLFSFLFDSKEKQISVHNIFVAFSKDIFECYGAVNWPDLVFQWHTYANCFKGAKGAFRALAGQFGSSKVYHLESKAKDALTSNVDKTYASSASLLDGPP